MSRTVSQFGELHLDNFAVVESAQSESAIRIGDGFVPRMPGPHVDDHSGEGDAIVIHYAAGEHVGRCWLCLSAKPMHHFVGSLGPRCFGLRRGLKVERQRFAR